MEWYPGGAKKRNLIYTTAKQVVSQQENHSKCSGLALRTVSNIDFELPNIEHIMCVQ